ncbi:MAG: hypothetical protein PQJ61_02025 [Spirochaetales bacterium]|uniref:Lipoprotein n=1 Tax=Candidatus Thalassospirochaeta sargassi TaxID=3119039 RepID=A0AAJ1IAC7_9SPIO|nr:hypothetical protein [Spirochaetales bacterium]
MKKKICKVGILLILPAVILISTSCTRSSTGEDSIEKAIREVESAKPSSEYKQDPVSEEDVSLSFSGISEIEGRDFLLFPQMQEELVFPADFIIGELQSSFEKDGEIPAIFSTADDFLSSVATGEPDYSLVLDEKKEFIHRNIEYGFKQAEPENYKIGRINTADTPARAAVRLEAAGGNAAGMIYFSKDGGWKVHDLHINFSDMNEAGEPENTDWYPTERLM